MVYLLNNDLKLSTLKPVLTTTYEQWPPVNNDQSKSPTKLKLLKKFAPPFDQQPPFEQLTLFWGPKS